MSYLAKRQSNSDDRFSCPSGGQWYACDSAPFFAGCCNRNPCGSNGRGSQMCAQGNLSPASFDANHYSQFPDASCGVGSNFYTCIYSQSSTFMGCCKSNPCSQGSCPFNDLTPAFLDRDDQKAAYISGFSTTSTATSSTTSSTSTATSSSTSSALPAAHKTNTAVVAGAAAGGALGLALIIGLLVWYFCSHAKKSRKGHSDELTRRMSDLPAAMAEKDKVHGHQDAPPVYTSPNPDQYYNQNPSQYAAYAHQQPYQQPQELPIEPLSPLPYVQRKSVASHRRNLSELSGDTAVRSELASPTPSPMLKQGGFVPASPQFVHQPSPMTPQSATFNQQAHAPSSPPGQTEDAVEQWMAYQERIERMNTMGEEQRYVPQGQAQGSVEEGAQRTSAFQEHGLDRDGRRGW